jgi:hypothetical protein
LTRLHSSGVIIYRNWMKNKSVCFHFYSTMSPF